jgi:hypothetical protein
MTAIQATTIRTLPQLIETVKALYAKATRAQGKARDLWVTLGIELKEAKARNRETGDLTWSEFAKQHFNFGQSRADELIRIADGRTTVEQVRADTAERVQKHAKAKPALANTGSSETAQDDEEVERDRKTCIALYQKAIDSDPEFAQWMAEPEPDDDTKESDDDDFLIDATVPGAVPTNKLITKVLRFWKSINPTFTAWIETDPDVEAVTALGTVLFAFAKDLDRRAWVGIKKQRRADAKMSRSNSKIYSEYRERFGGIGGMLDPERMRLIGLSLQSGLDHLTEEKQRHKKYAEQYNLGQEQFERTPITATMEHEYTAMIKQRVLYEGACSLAWPMYFQYRDEHPDLPPLTPDDLAYVGMWTSCAIQSTADPVAHG